MDDNCFAQVTDFSPVIKHDRQNRIGGGVTAWFHHNLTFKHWQHLESSEFESLWFTVWSCKMPRKFSRIILGIIYHPPSNAEGHRNLCNHIINCVDHIKRHHPYSGVMLVGDFNQFPDRLLVPHLKVKQIIKAPTRGSAVLDKCYTDIFPFYNDFLIMPPIGSSDHNAFLCYPNCDSSYGKGSLNKVTTRVMGQNEKAMFCYELKNIKWEPLYHLASYEEKVLYFTSTISVLMEKYFPAKVVKRHSKDKPWITDHFKSLVAKRQYAFISGDLNSYRLLRNTINRMSKRLEGVFYDKKVKQLRSSDSRNWWKGIKELLGLSNKKSPIERIAQAECDGDIEMLANQINEFFQSVGSHLQPISEENPHKHVSDPIPDEYLLRVEDVERRLSSLKTNKSTGPDGIPAWVLRDFCQVLAGPLTAIANASLQEGNVCPMWKFANIIPLPKVPSPKDITSDLRPISITSIPGKVVESFPVNWMYNSISDQIDPNQFGGVKNSSTTLALLKIVDYIAKNVDKPGIIVRMLLVDFAKAFDLVDHSIVLNKLSSLGVHSSLLKWSASFLSERQQCVKIGSSVSSASTINAGCPQGTLMGPLVFVAHINDLQPPGPVMTIKYVDDTNILHASSDPNDPTLQTAATYLSEWSRENNMKFNIKKSKELVFSFRKSMDEVPFLEVEGNTIERVKEVKVLGVVLRGDLKWNSHVEYMLRKANKRLCLLTLYRRAGLTHCNMIDIYKSIIRSVLEYCCVVWHSSLPKYLDEAVEKVQKRALHIIYGVENYDFCLEQSKLLKLSARREDQCKKLFTKMMDPDHKLNKMLPIMRNVDYNFREFNPLESMMCNTNRYSNSFLPYSIRNFKANS